MTELERVVGDLQRKVRELEREVEFYKSYAGAQIYMSDYRTADELRAAYRRALAENDILTAEIYALRNEIGDLHIRLALSSP